MNQDNDAPLNTYSPAISSQIILQAKRTFLVYNKYVNVLELRKSYQSTYSHVNTESL